MKTEITERTEELWNPIPIREITQSVEGTITSITPTKGKEKRAKTLEITTNEGKTTRVQLPNRPMPDEIDNIQTGTNITYERTITYDQRALTAEERRRTTYSITPHRGERKEEQITGHYKGIL